MIILVNEVVILLLLALSIPLTVLAFDIRKTLRSYGVDLGRNLRFTKDHNFVKAAQSIFDSNPDVAVFIYGHTHIPSLTRIDDRCIINTGTWLKRLVRTQPRVGMFPPIFVGSYHLNFFQIEETADENIRISYHRIPKSVKTELTLMERLLILGRSKKDLQAIPAEMILPGAKSKAKPSSALSA